MACTINTLGRGINADRRYRLKLGSNPQSCKSEQHQKLISGNRRSRTIRNCLLMMALLLMTAVVAQASEVIEVSGTIAEDTTWGPAGTVYVITGGDLTISTGATLTIEPGVVVKFEVLTTTSNKRRLIANGILDARC